jgi:phenylalanyl-tRNA synthetase beta chain
MKFSEQWLREWVNPPLSTAALAEQLTMAGLEVEGIAPVAGDFSGVVVAEVLDVASHPNADRLRVCKVNVGEAEALTIVCGAPNVRAGLRAPLARIGAVLPEGQKIGKGKLRGVESAGMLCSAKELGLSDAAAGLLELPGDAPVGMDLRGYLQLDDCSIELNVTPNRGDCLGIAGLARELGAECALSVTPPAFAPPPVELADRFPVEVSAGAACPRYVGRVLRGVNAAVPTPVWMQERLRRSGLRSISAIVDVTNYVMLELGQPMHAFDLAKLKGGIRVRMAAPGEPLTLLDGQTIELAEDMLVIADHEKPVALAGIMGGETTAVDAQSTDLFLESAFFTPTAISGRARRLKLHTDSSHRFERGVDFSGQARAMERATALILTICGGSAGPLLEAVSQEHLPAAAAIRLRRERINRVLGFSELTDDAPAILARLGMAVTPHDSGWLVTPPSSRFDIAIEPDLIEEVVRIGGYGRVPVKPPAGEITQAGVTEAGPSPAGRLRRILVDRGFHEVVTYSFVDAEWDRRMSGDSGAIALANPISQDMAVMRTSLWPGLIKALIHNQSRQQSRIRLFEIGGIFSNRDGKNIQNNKISGIVSGTSLPEQWGVPARPVDFFDLKADCEALLEAAGLASSAVVVASECAALHPGQSAEWRMGDRTIGRIGRLCHDLFKYLDLRQPVYLFEMELDDLASAVVPRYAPLSRFPAVRRDLSLTLPSAVPAAAVFKSVWDQAPDALQDLQLFDVYEGEGIDSGKKSIALGLIFQRSSSTLIDADVDTMVADIVGRLAGTLGAALRK